MVIAPPEQPTPLILFGLALAMALSAFPRDRATRRVTLVREALAI
jgi:hypothetical protein